MWKCGREYDREWGRGEERRREGWKEARMGGKEERERERERKEEGGWKEEGGGKDEEGGREGEGRGVM